MLRTDVLVRALLVAIAMCFTTSGLLLDDGQSLQTRILVLESEVAALQTAVHGLLNNQNLGCDIHCPRARSVAFMAQLTSDLVDPADGHVIVFDDVITNAGNAYNPVHGIFTAPVNGTYNLNLVASSPPTAASHVLHLLIMKNSGMVGFVFLDGQADYWFRRSTDITLRLAETDEVWVEVDVVSGSHRLGGCTLCTHFSGFLIEAE